MKKYFLIILIILLPLIAYSQVNIESIRNKNTKEGFYGNIKGGIQVQKGNVDIQRYDSLADLHFKKNIHHILLRASFSKGYQSEKKFQNSAFSHFRYTTMLHKFLGYEIFTQTEFDEFKSLELRQLLGFGIRLEHYFEKYVTIASGFGMMNDYEQTLSKQTSRDARINSYFTIKSKQNKKVNSLFSAVIYYQPLLFNHKDYRINLEANVKTNLIAFLNISIENSINFLYDTRPPEDILTNDFVLKTSLVYNW